MDWDAVELRFHESKVLHLLDRPVGSVEQNRSGRRTLQGQRPNLLGHVRDGHIESHSRVLQPLQVRLRGRHPERSVTEIPKRAIVHCLPALVAPRGVVDLPFRELRYVPRHDVVHQMCGILPLDEIFVERRDVEHARGMADRIVLHLRDQRIRRGREVSGPPAPLPTVACRRRPRMKWRSSSHDPPPGGRGPRINDITPLPLLRAARRARFELTDATCRGRGRALWRSGTTPS